MPGVENLRAAVLDTHAWIWMCAGDERAAELAGFSGKAVISAISIWETAMLSAKGRVVLKPDVKSWVDRNLQAPAELEPIHPQICIESCVLPDFHGDPADRLIVTTALVLGLPLITADAAIAKWNRRNALLQVVTLK